jgi:hypothetical protein
MKIEKGFKFMDTNSDYEVIEYMEQFKMYRLRNLTNGTEIELMSESEIQYYIDNITLMQINREKNRVFKEHQEAIEKAEQEKKLKAQQEYEFCYGYCDKMTAIQKGKILKTLNIRLAYNKNTYTRKDFIKMLIQIGYTPEIKNYNEWGKNGVIKKKENTYIMNGIDSFIDVTKTEYDYAKYLIDNKLVVSEAEAV